ncbi:MAG: Type 1 glutamine amidotransferase-like domain-containing protein [Candidatus Saccharimonadales bacterium]
MIYVLNGGRNERGVMSNPAMLALYRELGIERMLVVPLAIVEESWQDFWQQNTAFFRGADFSVQTVTTHDSAETTAQKIAWADSVYFPGGSQETLLSRIGELDIAVAIERAGDQIKLLGGGSAGAMIFGSQCILGHVEVKRLVPGMGWLAGSLVDSHFANRQRQPRLRAVLADNPELRGVGVDEDTAALFDEEYNLMQVVGPGSVYLYDNGIEKVHDSTS